MQPQTILSRKRLPGLRERCKHTVHQRGTAVAAAVAAAGGAATTSPTAVITGCSSGIGRKTAVFLADQGWRVFAGARSQPDLEALRHLHPRIIPLDLDVTAPSSIAAAAQQVEAAVEGSGVQLLLNNAGVGLVAPAEFVPLDEFRRVYDVNVFGALAVSQAFLPLLRQGQPGRIINVSSVAGHLTLPFWSPYCSSKAALESMSDCLRLELAAQGVPVVLIKPGPVATAIWEKSRQNSKRVVNALPPAAKELYGPQLQAMDATVKQSEESAIPIEEVVQVIYNAATCNDPASRFHIGDSAALTHWAKRLLPDRVWEGLVLRLFESKTSA